MKDLSLDQHPRASGTPAPSDRPVHHFTVDVEEHFQVSAFERLVPMSEWDRHPTRVANSTRRLLELLAEHGARGTFFTLGWLAERQPALVREIAAGGHEVASHSYDHRRVIHQTPEQFRESVRRSRGLLEDITGQQVLGFRAPSFSIVPGREWALDVLLEEGYVYDSSLFPIRRSGYGYPGTERRPHMIRRPAGELLELPPSTLSLLGQTLPGAGGAYLRLLPFGLVNSTFRQCEGAGYGGTFYTHPWELDPGQPRLPVSTLTRIRHYGGLRRTEPRIVRLLRRYRFDSIAASMRLGTWN